MAEFLFLKYYKKALHRQNSLAKALYAHIIHILNVPIPDTSNVNCVMILFNN